MCSRRFLCLGLISAFTTLLGPSLGNAQSSQLSYETSFSNSGTLLRRVVVKHPGCVTCSDRILNAEEEYVRKRVSDGPDVVFSLDRRYDQKKVSDLKAALEGLWKERGIAVEVSMNLTQVTKSPRYTVLEVDVCGKY